MTRLVSCVDFGSTFTKAALVDVDDGRLLATASHRTTLDTDVLDGWEACRAQLSVEHPGVLDAEVLACSSAGGGLRIGIVGNEELVTAEAGRRVALSSGARVVHIASGGLGSGASAALGDAAPDMILLVGGTDGGNAEALLASARELAFCAWPVPVVVAGNADAQAEVTEILSHAGVPHVLADNVVPRIGVLAPDAARAAIRAMFLVHVIGGKHLSARADFAAMVRGATPDLVLTAVQLLAESVGDVVAVDVGGATTDIHSVVEVDPEDSGLTRQVVAPMPASRTVEGDLGMRWSAVDTVRSGREAGLVEEQEYAVLHEAARERRDDPAYLPVSETDVEHDERLATVATGLALRRHAGRQQVRFGPDGRLVERTGKDLREVGLVVGSGGVLRHNATEVAARVLGASCGHDFEGGWLLPRAPRTVVDRDYVLAAAGLLSGEHPAVARRLLQRLVEEDER
ncbi:MAG: glutamate mutase L [Nocardioidaceae bacterium]